MDSDELETLNFHKPVQDLCKAILTDPEINMFFHQMFWQQKPQGPQPSPLPIKSWQYFIWLLNGVMTLTPRFSTGPKRQLVGFPINALINWPMATTAGFACFLNNKVNKLFKGILNCWKEHLQSPKSQETLNSNPGGWFTKEALEAMIDEYGNTFQQQYKCKPGEKAWGFASWDAFFTREFNDTMRPLPADNGPDIIVNACESAPFAIERNVNTRSLFWIKKQPYSLNHMLNNNGWSKYFHGGTVYQGFLSATCYHRWNSPVDGTIIETELIDGSYYSQTYNIQDDTSAPNASQGYCTQVASRGAIYIMSDNPVIGIMCFLSIGMSEVSSNEITVCKGQRIRKGEQLGMFHFGGSSHVLIFRPGLELKFDLGHNDKPGLDTVNIPLRQKLATVLNK